MPVVSLEAVCSNGHLYLWTGDSSSKVECPVCCKLKQAFAKKQRQRRTKVEEPKRGRPNTLGHTVAMNIKVPDYVYAALASIATQAGKSMSDLARDALGEWLLVQKLDGKSIAAR